jgi:pyrroloquinoline quinone biosynthesis protein D
MTTEPSTTGPSANVPSTPEPTESSVPHIGKGFRLQWEPAQDCHVLLFPEGMVKLNQSGGEIMKRCDGKRSIATIVHELEQAFAATGLREQVMSFIQMAGKQKWLVWE